MDGPTAAPGTAETLRRRETVLFAKLDLAADILPAGEVELLRAVLAKGPQDVPALAFGRDGAEQARLESVREALTTDETYVRLLDRLTEVLDHLEGNNAQAAKERAALLLQILANYRIQLSSYNEAAGSLTRTTRDTVLRLAGLDATMEAFVESALTQGPPFEPPAGADPALTTKHDKISLAWEALLQSTADAHDTKNAEGLGDRWTRYKADVDAYESACETAGRAQFLEAIGMPADVSPEEFAAFQSELLAPLAPVPAGLSLQDKEDAQRQFAALESRRSELAVDFPVNLRHGFPAGNRKEWAQQLLIFMLQRSLYDTKVLGKQDSPMNVWLLYAGVIANEMLEEGLEGAFSVSGESALLKIRGARGLEDALQKGILNKVELFKDLSAPARAKLLSGWSQVTKTLAARGVPVQRLGSVLSTLNKIPLGKQFWSELFVVESPVTILLWGLYMHTSENKFKACVQFGSFLAFSGAANAGLTAVNATLRSMGLASKIPAHPAVKFALVMGAAFLAADKIEAFSNWLDKAIPNSPGKDAAMVGVGIVTGEPIFSMIGEVSEITGLSGVMDQLGISGFDPERDLMAYLKEDPITIENLSADRRFIHKLADWNARVDQALASQNNPVIRQFWELQKVDSSSWPKRRAVLLYSQCAALAATEKSLNDQLRAKGVIGGAASLALLELATDDAVGIRNDRLVSYVLAGEDTHKKAEAYCSSLPATDPLRLQWNEYCKIAGEIASDVAVYRHLGIYARNQWIGSVRALGAPQAQVAMPPFVEEGLVEEIAHRIRMRRATMAGTYGMKQEQFAGVLAGAVKYRDAVSLPSQIMASLAEMITKLKTEGIPRPSSIAGYESRDSLQDAYTALRNAVGRASRTMSADQVERLLEPIRALLLAGKPATEQDMRSVVDQIQAAMLASERMGRPFVPMSAEQRQVTKAGSIPAYTRGQFRENGQWVDKYGEVRPPLNAKVFNMAFGSDLEKSNPDVYLIESDRSSTYFTSYKFFCKSADREDWTVEVKPVHKMALPAGQVGIERGREHTIPFSKWLEANMEDGMKLEPDFARVQQTWIKKREEVRERDRIGNEISLNFGNFLMKLNRWNTDSPETSLARIPEHALHLPGFQEASRRDEWLRKEWKQLEGSKIFEDAKQWYANHDNLYKGFNAGAPIGGPDPRMLFNLIALRGIKVSEAIELFKRTATYLDEYNRQFIFTKQAEAYTTVALHKITETKVNELPHPARSSFDLLPYHLSGFSLQVQEGVIYKDKTVNVDERDLFSVLLKNAPRGYRGKVFLQRIDPTPTHPDSIYIATVVYESDEGTYHIRYVADKDRNGKIHFGLPYKSDVTKKKD